MAAEKRTAHEGLQAGGADMIDMRMRSNSGCFSCFVKMSERLLAEGMSTRTNTPAATHDRMKWCRMSMCFDLLLFTSLVAGEVTGALVVMEERRRSLYFSELRKEMQHI